MSALAFRETLELIGRSDMVGCYSHDRHGRDAVKHAEREKVLSFLLREHVSSRRPKLLSMPGVDWVFEQMMLAARPNTQIVGIERSFSVYARARRSMPHATGCLQIESEHLQDRALPFGTGQIVYSRRPAMRKKKKTCGKATTRSHRLVLMDSATYASLFVTDYGATLAEKIAANRKFGGRTAAWLDFTGSICASVLETISHLPLMLSPSVDVPIAITVRNGRDGMNGVEARIAALVNAQPSFRVAEYWTYVGHGGASMLTVCGVIPAEAPIQGAQP